MPSNPDSTFGRLAVAAFAGWLISDALDANWASASLVVFLTIVLAMRVLARHSPADDLVSADDEPAHEFGFSKAPYPPAGHHDARPWMHYAE
jgi:ABC-type Fe3+-siderophore transport system permease subunit